MEKIDKTFNNGTLEIAFYNPKANSFTSNMLRELKTILNEASKDNSVRSILIRSGNDKLFSAGASFDEMLEINDFESAKQFFSGFANVISEMIKSPKIIVTLVEGKSIGGSVGLVAASDYVVATINAEFRLSEFSVGIGPFVIAPVIEQKIGQSALMEMTIDTEYKSAQWALSKGLVNKIIENTEALEFVRNFCNSLNTRSPLASQFIKSTLWNWNREIFDTIFNNASISANLLLTQETKDFLNKFKSK